MNGFLSNKESPQPDASEAVMLEAVRLALRGKGATAPNPCVGAVLTRNGHIVARGWHRQYGGPHAEVEVLRDAEQNAIDPADCTLWVTLEPCNHTGKTPPCTQAVLAAGVKHVVIGTLDPNPDVAGGGAEFLRKNRVKVELGVAETACRDLIADFLVWKTTPRPYSLLKLAATLDGKIATRNGHSQWISCPESRRLVHDMRGLAQAVIVGGNTFYQDNPQLTRRHGNATRQPLAVVVTSRLPDPKADFALVRDRAIETIFWTSEQNAASPRAAGLQKAGCRVWGLGPGHKGLDLAEGFERLRQECGCLYTLCEGGGSLGMALLEQRLADEFVLFLAPRILGDESARSLFSGRKIEYINEGLELRLSHLGQSGQDALLTFRPNEEQ